MLTETFLIYSYMLS